MKLLIRYGADPSLKNDQGLSPLQIAIQADHLDATKILREAVAKRKESPLSPQRGNGPTMSRSPRRTNQSSSGGVSSPSSNHSRGSSRNSSLETIVETSPVLSRSVSSPQPERGQQNHFASSELSGAVDGSSRPKAPLAIGSCSAVSIATASSAPSPSPSINSEPAHGTIIPTRHERSHRHSSSHSDLRGVKNFFHWTLSSFRRSSLVKRSNSTKTCP